MSDEYDEALSRTIRHAVAQELDSRSRIDASKHRLHHEYLEREIECRRRRSEIMQRAAQHALGWSTVLGMGWLGTVLWAAFKEAAKR